MPQTFQRRSYWQGWQGPGPNNSQALTMQQVRGNKWADAIGFRLYDTVRVQAGIPIQTDPFQFFQIPQGEQTQGLNFGGNYRKGLMDTNMRSSGTLPKDHHFMVQSMQIKVTISGATAADYGISGEALQMPTDPTAAAAVASVNLLEAILEASTYAFIVGIKKYEEGTGDLFPTCYGVSGFAGGGSEVNFESVSNNGFGRPFRFPVPRSIDQLRELSVDAQFGYQLTPTNNFRIKCILEGLLYRPIQ